jgi:LysR family hydrogen peroxide-inducible transcriptional activator
VLAEQLKNGEVDVILIALPFGEPGIETRPVYDEPFFVAVPKGHPWEARKRGVSSEELTRESLLLLGEGHCFRDQVLEICHVVRAKDRSPLARTVEGGSLETIRQMVAGGVGVTVLPATSVNSAVASDLIRILPFTKPAPTRRVALAWRRSFPRPEAIEALRKAILACNLPQVEKLA